MNKFLFAAALIVSGLLVGCNQLTQYTITEQEINQSLAKHKFLKRYRFTRRG